MTCDEYLRIWNERLDGLGPPSADRAEACDDHASSCPACRQRAMAFRLFAGPLPRPPVPEGLSDRIVAAWEADGRRALPFRVAPRWGWAGLAAAAVVFAVLSPAIRGLVRAPRDLTMRPAVPRPWSLALAEATTATLDLARETSAPAARWGQELVLASRPQDLAWPVAAIEPAPDPGEMIQSVSRKVNSGVRPLSGSARRAFSFLVAPAATADPVPPKDDPGA